MTVINTNTAAINAQHNLSKVQSSMDEAMARLSSGKRINAAADDAAGLSIATRMESQIIGMQMTMRNANDGISLVSSVEGALQEYKHSSAYVRIECASFQLNLQRQRSRCATR